MQKRWLFRFEGTVAGCVAGLLPDAGSEGPDLLIMQAKWSELSSLSSTEMTARMPKVKADLDAVKSEQGAANQLGVQILRKLEILGSMMAAYYDANAKFAEQLQKEGCLPEMVCAHVAPSHTLHVQLCQFAIYARKPTSWDLWAC